MNESGVPIQIDILSVSFERFINYLKKSPIEKSLIMLCWASRSAHSNRHLSVSFERFINYLKKKSPIEKSLIMLCWTSSSTTQKVSSTWLCNFDFNITKLMTERIIPEFFVITDSTNTANFSDPKSHKTLIKKSQFGHMTIESH